MDTFWPFPTPDDAAPGLAERKKGSECVKENFKKVTTSLNKVLLVNIGWASLRSLGSRICGIT